MNPILNQISVTRSHSSCKLYTTSNNVHYWKVEYFLQKHSENIIAEILKANLQWAKLLTGLFTAWSKNDDMVFLLYLLPIMIKYIHYLCITYSIQLCMLPDDWKNNKYNMDSNKSMFYGERRHRFRVILLGAFPR